jgi:phage replication O-like protein O
MTNIIQIDKSRGFTRMDNSLMEAVAAVDLPGRELRILMAIARNTLGYQQESRRITADELAKLTNIRRDVASKAISHLLARRVIFRVGGSRGEIGISPVSEWQFFEPSNDNLSEIKTSHSDKVVSLGNAASETKTAHSLLYTKKEPLVTLPSEEITPPQEPSQAVAVVDSKPKAKASLSAKDLLADNPHALSAETIADYIALRVKKRATTTARVWRDLNAKLTELAGKGVKPEQAMGIALVQGWQGFEVQWVLNRIKPEQRPVSRHAGPDFNSDDTSWANDLGFM